MVAERQSTRVSMHYKASKSRQSNTSVGLGGSSVVSKHSLLMLIVISGGVTDLSTSHAPIESFKRQNKVPVSDSWNKHNSIWIHERNDLMWWGPKSKHTYAYQLNRRISRRSTFLTPRFISFVLPNSLFNHNTHANTLQVYITSNGCNAWVPYLICFDHCVWSFVLLCDSRGAVWIIYIFVLYRV